ncbi:MAG: hypothetical protein AAF790_07630 [Planctomycetota bacterium]
MRKPSNQSAFATPRPGDAGLPGWIPPAAVAGAVLVLLRGFDGAAAVLWLQLHTLAASVLGGPESVRVVLWQTLPLALSAAAVAYLVAGGRLAFDGPWSVVAVAAIVLAGAWLGSGLRQAVEGRGVAATAAADGSEPVAAGAAANSTPAAVAPLPVLPKANGVMGIVAAAINQLLGYLAAYRPRVFAASLLAGGYVGWSWQRRIARWRGRWEAWATARPASAAPEAVTTAAPSSKNRPPAPERHNKAA